METRSRAKPSGKRQRENAEIKPRQIFGQLDLRSLFNVANANKWLRPAARDVYIQKYGEEMLYFRRCGIVRPNTRAKSHETDTNKSLTLEESKYCIYGLNFSLQFLRCFGPCISRLSVDYGSLTSKRFDHVHQYINDYCADTLTRIDFQSMPNIEIEQFQKVFVNIERISVSGELGRQWPTFVKCFPNVRDLCLEHVRMVDRCPVQPFEHLIEFFLQESRCIGFTMHQFATDVLSGIHHLQQFVMTVIPDDEPKKQMWALLNWIGLNPLLEELVYELGKRELILVNAAEVQRIVADYPALIELRLEDYQFTADDAMTVARQLNSLQRFKFQMLKSEYEHMKTQLDDDWYAVDDDEDDDVAYDDDRTCVALYRG